MSSLRPELVRENAIRRERGRTARRAVLTIVVETQLLFLAWVGGWMLGPAPLTAADLIAGAAFAFGIGAALSWPFVRRRVEAAAELALRLREHGRRRRVVVFRDHLTIGDEIVLRDLIESAAQNGSLLDLSYRAAIDGERRHRSLAGTARDLSALQSALSGPVVDTSTPAQ